MKYIKKHLKLIVLILTCLIIYLIYNSKVEEKNTTYISLGDGYARGLNSYGENNYGYNDYLKDYLKYHNKLNLYFNNFSYNDMTINDLYKDILINVKDNQNDTIKQALRESNLLTISIGLNDLIYNKSLMSCITVTKERQIINKTLTDFDRLINELRKYYKYDIYLVGYYNFYPQETVERSLLNKLNKKYKDYCSKNDITYVEINENLEKYYENPNNNYPNILGYKQIYREILSEITIK